MIIKRLSITLIVLFVTAQPTYSMEKITHQFSQLHIKNETEKDFALIEACKKENYQLVYKLLEEKKIPLDLLDLQDHEGKTALFWACVRCNISLVELLLQHGANPNIQDLEGSTQLLLACFNDSETPNKKYITIVELLFSKNADPNICDNGGYSPLLYSCGKNSELSKLNLQCGAHPNFQDPEGSTPLHYACSNKNTTEHLLVFGANPTIPNNQKYTPLHFACIAKNIDVVKMLLEWPIVLAEKHSNYRKSFFIFLCWHKRFSIQNRHLSVPKPLIKIIFIEGQPDIFHKTWFNLNDPHTAALAIISQMLNAHDDQERTPLKIAQEQTESEKIINFLKKVERTTAEGYNTLTSFLKASKNQRKIFIIKKKK